jgi:hypothetical protein
MIEYRHGDVDIFKTDSVPASAKLEKSTTIALGEVTGHHHTIYPLGETDVKVYTETDVKSLVDKYIVIEGGKAVLQHQEHEAIILNPGVYETKIEQDFSPYDQEYRRVVD